MNPARAFWARARRGSLLSSALLAITLFPRPAASEQQVLVIGGGTIDLNIDGGPANLSNPDLAKWIQDAGHAVAGYFNGFPVVRMKLHVRLQDGSGVHGGKANGWGRLPAIDIEVGRHGGPRSLSDDWVLTHEMIHLGFPSIAGPHDWLGEGLATYVEPIARTRNGTMSVNQFWLELVRDMPQGIPDPYDRGFNLTPSWEATYWGGALFWFLADIEIRVGTGGKKGLEDALRAINQEGGTIQEEWSVKKMIEVGDRATGVPVLRRLYNTWATQRGEIDFPVLLRRLGVSRSGDRITFDDTASLVRVRKALTKRYAPPEQTRK